MAATIKPVRLAAASLALALLLAACGESGTTAHANRSTGSPAWVLAEAPADPASVSTAKASAAEGDAIVIRGRIGGRKTPITDESAVFTVMDLTVPHCGQIPGDTCGTPWDYCCETPESITANSATIQIVDDAGQPIAASPAEHGFAPLDEVIVTGTVAPRPNDQVLIVRATGVHRVGG